MARKHKHKPSVRSVEPLVYASKLSPKAVDQFIAEAKHLDYRTARYDRWTADLEAKIKAALVDCRDVPEMKAALNHVVVAEIGGGYFGRGPFAL